VQRPGNPHHSIILFLSTTSVNHSSISHCRWTLMSSGTLEIRFLSGLSGMIRRALKCCSIRPAKTYLSLDLSPLTRASSIDASMCSCSFDFWCIWELILSLVSGRVLGNFRGSDGRRIKKSWIKVCKFSVTVSTYSSAKGMWKSLYGLAQFPVKTTLTYYVWHTTIRLCCFPRDQWLVFNY
jgi:hypothetical protein